MPPTVQHYGAQIGLSVFLSNKDITIHFYTCIYRHLGHEMGGNNERRVKLLKNCRNIKKNVDEADTHRAVSKEKQD